MKKIVFETFSDQNLGYCEVRTFFEIEEDKIPILKKMTKEEFYEFLSENAETQITDASVEIENIDFNEFDKI
jgi:hypothetical protein